MQMHLYKFCWFLSGFDENQNEILAKNFKLQKLANSNLTVAREYTRFRKLLAFEVRGTHGFS